LAPEERNLVSDLFGRLAAVENSPRDPDAERIIREGLARAPNALYALVQTTLVQDEALKQADSRIRELEAQLANARPPQSSFLGGARDNVWGRPGAPRAGSVPSVPPTYTPAAAQASAPVSPPGGYMAPPAYAPMGQPAAAASGSSFLGTAAAAAVGAIGGTLLMNSMRSMMGGPAPAGHAFGGSHGGGPGGPDPFNRSDAGGPWVKQDPGNLGRELWGDTKRPANEARSETSQSPGYTAGNGDYDATENQYVAGNDEQTSAVYGNEDIEQAQDYADATQYEDGAAGGFDGGDQEDA